MSLLKPLAKSVLVLLVLNTVDSAKDTAIHEEILGSGTTTLILPNEDLNDIIKIVKSIEESGLPIKGISKTVENKVKEQKRGFLDMLAAKLASHLLGNVASDEGVIRAHNGTFRAGQDFQCCLNV